MSVYYLDWRGTRLRLREGETVIGRGLGCEVHLDDLTSSRRHAAVRCDQGRLTVRDLGSRNGTFVNGARVSGDDPLVEGDRLLVGESLFTIGVAEPASLGDGRLSLPSAVAEGLALVEQGAQRGKAHDLTQPQVGTVEVIESLLHSPHARDEPVAVASMIQGSVDRLLRNLERRVAALPPEDEARLFALIEEVKSWLGDDSLEAWSREVQRRVQALR